MIISNKDELQQKPKQKRKLNRRSPTHKFQTLNITKNNSSPKHDLDKDTSQLEVSYKLPKINMKVIHNQPNEQVITMRTKKQSKRQAFEGLRILQIIKKEMSMQKKNYFETISSDKALIVKGKIKSNLFGGFNNFNRYDENKQLQMLMTPRMKQHQITSKRFPHILPITKQVMMSARRSHWLGECTPWGVVESEQVP